MDWKTIDQEYAKDFAARMDAAMPEPLYESAVLPSPKICLVCARGAAQSGLYSGTRLIVPLCKACAADWNLYGYDVLKRIRPKQLILRLVKYKLVHVFARPGVVEISQDVRELTRWAKKMKAIMKASHSAT